MADSHIYQLLLFMVAVQLAFGMPIDRSERALGYDGVPSVEKEAIHRQRLALYNMLDSPGYNPDLERQSISRYIPLGLSTRHQAIVQPYKETPISAQVYTTSNDLLMPSNSNRAPYATDHFIQPLNYQQIYPYLASAVYAPSYPYVYKAVAPEEVP